MNVPLPMPFTVTGTDMQKYVIDQFPDQDGVNLLHIFLQKAPYEFQEVYVGKPFMFEDPQPEDA